MKSFLLDTHVLLWYLGGDEKLPAPIVEFIANPKNQIVVSMASLWEIAIKIKIGKLALPRAFDDLEQNIKDYGFEILPLGFEEIKKTINLDFHHRDPFDRLLIAQSLTYNFPVIGDDRIFDSYGVDLLWQESDPDNFINFNFDDADENETLPY